MTCRIGKSSSIQTFRLLSQKIPKAENGNTDGSFMHALPATPTSRRMFICRPCRLTFNACGDRNEDHVHLDISQVYRRCRRRALPRRSSALLLWCVFICLCTSMNTDAAAEASLIFMVIIAPRAQDVASWEHVGHLLKSVLRASVVKEVHA